MRNSKEKVVNAFWHSLFSYVLFVSTQRCARMSRTERENASKRSPAVATLRVDHPVKKPDVVRKMHFPNRQKESAHNRTVAEVPKTLAEFVVPRGDSRGLRCYDTFLCSSEILFKT